MTTGREQTTVEYALRHPTGRVDEWETSTVFGPTTDRTDAQVRLDVANSDCLCSDGDEAHTLVVRTITVSEWKDERL